MDGLEKLYLLISTDGLNYLLPVSKIERILDGLSPMACLLPMYPK